MERNTPLQTHPLQRSDNSWFEAIEIIDENSTEYLVRWAGNDPTGKEWVPSWV
jgi:hypothetical protein